MSVEICHNPKIQKVLWFWKELLEANHDITNWSICYPWCSIDTWPSTVFSEVVFLDYNATVIEYLQNKWYNGICETYADHNQQYDLVIEMRSQWKPKDIMKLVKPWGYIISEENYGLPLALELSNQFVLIKNLSKKTQEPPKNVSMWAFWNWCTDFYLYKKLFADEIKKPTIKQRLLHLFAK